MTEQQKSRVLDINKIAATTIPSMAYMFSDKLATSAENTSDNLTQRGRHSIGLQCNICFVVAKYLAFYVRFP